MCIKPRADTCEAMLLELYCFSKRYPMKLHISDVCNGRDTGWLLYARKSCHECLYADRAAGDKDALRIEIVVQVKSAIDVEE